MVSLCFRLISLILCICLLVLPLFLPFILILFFPSLSDCCFLFVSVPFCIFLFVSVSLSLCLSLSLSLPLSLLAFCLSFHLFFCVSRGLHLLYPDLALQAFSCEPWTCWVCIPTLQALHTLMYVYLLSKLSGTLPAVPRAPELGGSDWGAREGDLEKRTFSLELWGV